MKPKQTKAPTETAVQLQEQNESNPQSLIQLAVESKLPIEYLERLMVLKERFDAQKSHTDFLSAMSKFQSICPVLEKTKLVSFGTTKYKYAPLGEIASTIRESMRDCGLSYRWEMKDETDKLLCTCIISHIGGSSVSSSMSASRDGSGNKNEIQSRGSAITYLQRYTLIAALGIPTADEDNDAQTVNKKPEEKKQPEQPPISQVDFEEVRENAIQKMQDKKTVADLNQYYRVMNKQLQEDQTFRDAIMRRREEILSAQPQTTADENRD